MFDKITKTWNPVVGCLHNCTYCWARKLAETKLSHTERYRAGFKPKLIESELARKFRNEFVFVSDMGDLFGSWVPSEWIVKVIEATRNSPSSYFLFLTKNPERYKEFLSIYPANLVLGATIETNRSLHAFSKAPPTFERYTAMRDLSYERKLISVEPIMDFDLDVFAEWIENIAPILVHVGYDNWHSCLPEPSLFKTEQLIDKLKAFTRVKLLTMREGTTHAKKR
jgi:protein gp37